MADSAQELIRALPCWRGAPQLAHLPGGLSNRNFRVRDDAGEFVARLGQDYPFHHVLRRREAAASLWAGEAGLAPGVHFAGQGALVTRFIAGATMDAQRLRQRLPEAIDLIARCHRELLQRARGEAAMFYVFHVIRDYADALRRAGHGLAPELTRLVALAGQLEAVQIPLPIIFGHHDLLPANFIADAERLWLLDWEYAAFGTPLFDLANLAANCGCEGREDEALLRQYFNQAPDAALHRAFGAMKLASALREWLWACVSQLHLTATGANYIAYALECRAKFERAAQVYAEQWEGPP